LHLQVPHLTKQLINQRVLVIPSPNQLINLDRQLIPVHSCCCPAIAFHLELRRQAEYRH
jgi:hypothetical protein